LLIKDPTKRLGAKGAEGIKRHPFFSGINWKDVLQRKLKPSKPILHGQEPSKSIKLNKSPIINVGCQKKIEGWSFVKV